MRSLGVRLGAEPIPGFVSVSPGEGPFDWSGSRSHPAHLDLTECHGQRVRRVPDLLQEDLLEDEPEATQSIVHGRKLRVDGDRFLGDGDGLVEGAWRPSLQMRLDPHALGFVVPSWSRQMLSWRVVLSEGLIRTLIRF